MPIIENERYEIDPNPIGRGGFGEVYQAYDLLFERQVVIKTIVASHLYGINDPRFRKQFFKESLISARLGSETDKIVRVFDYGYDRTTDLPFFVMEYVKGHDLTREVGTFSLEQSFQLLGDMLTALRIAHVKGVVHSDISPDNIMYDEAKDIYKLNDFGLARLLNSTLMSRGSVKSLIGGKPGYLPLDDWQTGNRTSHSDLYSLAVTITQLVTGKIPVWELATGSLNAPDLALMFQGKLGSKLDKRHFEKYDNLYGPRSFPFSCQPEEGKRWTFKEGRDIAYACDLTAKDLVDGLANILTKTFVTVEDTIDFFSGCTLQKLAPQEEAYREDQAKKKAEAAALKKATEDQGNRAM